MEKLLWRNIAGGNGLNLKEIRLPLLMGKKTYERSFGNGEAIDE